jgi:hypothetical protein
MKVVRNLVFKSMVRQAVLEIRYSESESIPESHDTERSVRTGSLWDVITLAAYSNIVLQCRHAAESWTKPPGDLDRDETRTD